MSKRLPTYKISEKEIEVHERIDLMLEEIQEYKEIDPDHLPQYVQIEQELLNRKKYVIMEVE